jgi:hypothetical protein
MTVVEDQHGGEPEPVSGRVAVERLLQEGLLDELKRRVDAVQ